MKRIILLIVILGLVACGKSQEEIAKEKQAAIQAQKAKEQQALLAKQQAEMKRIEDLVKYNLRDGESARFRNVIQNCGEVNAKNAMGAYVGFSRFIVRPDTNAVIYESPDNQYFDILAKEYCHSDYLAKYPVQNYSVAADAATAAAQDAALVAKAAAQDAAQDAALAAKAAAQDALSAAPISDLEQEEVSKDQN